MNRIKKDRLFGDRIDRIDRMSFLSSQCLTAGGDYLRVNRGAFVDRVFPFLVDGDIYYFVQYPAKILEGEKTWFALVSKTDLEEAIDG